jgi:hypothetical protein
MRRMELSINLTEQEKAGSEKKILQVSPAIGGGGFIGSWYVHSEYIMLYID